MLEALKRLGSWLHRRAENLLALMLAIMFTAFILQIIFRHVLDLAMGWTFELSVIMWVWLVPFGSAFVLPYLGVLLAVLVLITFSPDLVLWLPRLFGYQG